MPSDDEFDFNKNIGDYSIGDLIGIFFDPNIDKEDLTYENIDEAIPTNETSFHAAARMKLKKYVSNRDTKIVVSDTTCQLSDFKQIGGCYEIPPFKLTSILKNVISIELTEFRIPRFYDIDSFFYKNNYFKIGLKWYEISSGYYQDDYSLLCEQLNKKSTSDGITFFYSSLNGKISIQNDNDDEYVLDFTYDMNIHWKCSLSYILGIIDKDQDGPKVKLPANTTLEMPFQANNTIYDTIKIHLNDYVHTRTSTNYIFNVDDDNTDKSMPSYYSNTLNVNDPTLNCDGTPSGLKPSQVANLLLIFGSQDKKYGNVNRGVHLFYTSTRIVENIFVHSYSRSEAPKRDYAPNEVDITKLQIRITDKYDNQVEISKECSISIKANYNVKMSPS